MGELFAAVPGLDALAGVAALLPGGGAAAAALGAGVAFFRAPRIALILGAIAAFLALATVTVHLRGRAELARAEGRLAIVRAERAEAVARENAHAAELAREDARRLAQAVDASERRREADRRRFDRIESALPSDRAPLPDAIRRVIEAVAQERPSR